MLLREILILDLYNLVESGTAFTQTQLTIYCVTNAFIIDLPVK